MYGPKACSPNHGGRALNPGEALDTGAALRSSVEAMSFTIAIDGPAASGKGTLSRRLAAALDLAHLDTGLTYRAVAHALASAGRPLDDETLAVNAARSLDLAAMDRDVLSAHGVGEAASKVAVMPRVREALVEMQRRFAAQPPNGHGGAVLDGRDIGTVVCPDAALKLYVTASATERARRRWNEMRERGVEADLEAVEADIARRDRRDTERDDSPLRPAADAHLLDTTAMSMDEAFEAALALARAVRVRA